jgi:hypothetical protein
METKSSDKAYVNSLQTFGPVLSPKFHSLSFLKTSIAIHLNSTEVDEDILTIILRNEAKALLRVEPFYRTGRHSGDLPSLNVTMKQKGNSRFQ